MNNQETNNTVSNDSASSESTFDDTVTDKTYVPSPPKEVESESREEPETSQTESNSETENETESDTVSLADKRREAKEIFYEEMNKSKQSIVKTQADYLEQIAQIEEAEKKLLKERSIKEKYHISHFAVLTIGDVKRIIRRKSVTDENPKIYLYLEELYDTISKIHLSIGHKGSYLFLTVFFLIFLFYSISIVARLHTHEKSKERFENVSIEAIKLFLSTCFECERSKRKNTTSNLVVKPIRSTERLIT